MAIRVLIYLFLVVSATAHAGQSVNLLVVGDLTRHAIRNSSFSSEAGGGFGVLLDAPDAATNVFKWKKSKGGASASFGIDLDLGFEIGIFYARDRFIFDSQPISARMMRMPMMLWLQVNSYFSLGWGAHFSRILNNVPTGMHREHYGAIAGARMNFFPSKPIGFAVEGRYHHGITNVSRSLLSAYFDGMEVLAGIRFGKL